MTPVWTDAIANLWWRVILASARAGNSLWWSQRLRDGTVAVCGQNCWALLDLYKRGWM